jgi:signal peptidase I
VPRRHGGTSLHPGEAHHLIHWEPAVPTEGDDDELPPAGTERPPRLTRTLAELPLLAVIAIVIAFVLKTFLAQAFYIPSESMTPQLEIGDRVVVSKLSYQLHDPRRGDVVVFDSPTAPADDAAFPVKVFREALEAVGIRKPGEEELIKRVIGLPGETLTCREGRVFIDGRLLEEPYLPEGTMTECDQVIVPEGTLFMMGDNRMNSSDSRRFGPVPDDSLVGRAILRVWPPPRIAFL